MTVAVVHIGFVMLLEFPPIEVRRAPYSPEPMMVELLGLEVGITTSPLDSPYTPDPRVNLAVPDLSMDSMAEESTESPRIDSEQQVFTLPFAQRANLRDGEVGVVILRLQIAADGSVIAAEVVRSTGGDDLNAAAIEYARSTRWIPGVVDGEPQAMQASLTVILGESA